MSQMSKIIIFAVGVVFLPYQNKAMETPDKNHVVLCNNSSPKDVFEASRTDLTLFEGHLKTGFPTDSLLYIDTYYKYKFGTHFPKEKNKYLSLIHALCDDYNPAALSIALQYTHDASIKDSLGYYPMDYISLKKNSLKTHGKIIQELYTLLLKHGTSWHREIYPLCQFIPNLPFSTLSKNEKLFEKERSELIDGILSNMNADTIKLRGISGYLFGCLTNGFPLTAKVILLHLYKHGIPLSAGIQNHINSNSITLTGKAYEFDPETLIFLRYYQHLYKYIPALGKDKKLYLSLLPRELQKVVMAYVIYESKGKPVEDGLWYSIKCYLGLNS